MPISVMIENHYNFLASLHNINYNYLERLVFIDYYGPLPSFALDYLLTANNVGGRELSVTYKRI